MRRAYRPKTPEGAANSSYVHFLFGLIFKYEATIEQGQRSQGATFKQREGWAMGFRPAFGVRWTGRSLRPTFGVYYTPSYRLRYRHRPYVTLTNARWHLDRVVLFVLIVWAVATLGGGH